MGQIQYNYPGMLATAGELHGHAAALTALGANVESEQASLGASWQGTTGGTVNQWITQWNAALSETTEGLRGMASAHENNTTGMLQRDLAQGGKWGG